MVDILVIIYINCIGHSLNSVIYSTFLPINARRPFKNRHFSKRGAYPGTLLKNIKDCTQVLNKNLWLKIGSARLFGVTQHIYFICTDTNSHKLVTKWFTLCPLPPARQAHFKFRFFWARPLTFSLYCYDVKSLIYYIIILNWPEKCLKLPWLSNDQILPLSIDKNE